MLKKTEKIIQNLAKHYALKVVMLFGSEAKGKARPGSDIDLAILANPSFYDKKFSDFNFDLMRAQEAEHREIEVVPISNQNLLLLFNIFNDGRPLYIADPQEYYRLCNWARISYEESQRFFRGRQHLLEQRIGRLK